MVVDDLSPDQTYDFRVVAVDGRFETPSKIQEVYTYSSSTLPRFELDESRSRNVSHSGWFIGKYYKQCGKTSNSFPPKNYFVK